MNQRTARDIQADIEQTRTETGHTIDEIQARISPSEIVDQVVWHLRSGGGRTLAQGAGEFAKTLGRTIRQNPVPSLLIGTGLAWLALTSMREQGRLGYEGEAEPGHDELGRHRAPDPAAARYGHRMPQGEPPTAREPDPAAAGHHGARAHTFADRPAATTPERHPQRTPTVEAILASDPHAPFGATR